MFDDALPCLPLLSTLTTASISKPHLTELTLSFEHHWKGNCRALLLRAQRFSPSLDGPASWFLSKACSGCTLREVFLRECSSYSASLPLSDKPQGKHREKRMWADSTALPTQDPHSLYKCLPCPTGSHLHGVGLYKLILVCFRKFHCYGRWWKGTQGKTLVLDGSNTKVPWGKSSFFWQCVHKGTWISVAL